MKRLTMAFMLLLTVSTPVLAATVDVFDISINAGETVNWTRDNIYVLNERVYVEDGAVLNIEAGTVIWGKPSADPENASCLIISRGGKIYALGTAAEPIIFTAEGDDIANPADILYNAQGLWGGLIILGKAVNNEPDTGDGFGTGLIEGIPDDETGRGIYGGNDDTDDSGTLRYVSIRHGGTEITSGKEINGLSLASVGSGTTIEYVEVFSNYDDGFEWWGGTVECKNLISAFCGDDMFDYDQGFRGKGQFWFGVYAADDGNHAGEHDGGDTVKDATPFSHPTIYNVTYIGSGVGSTSEENDLILKIVDNAGGIYKNSIFTDFTEKGIKIEDVDGVEDGDSKARLATGDIEITNNLFWHIGTETDTWDIIGNEQAHVIDYLSNAAQSNGIADPGLAISRAPATKGLQAMPDVDGPAYANLAALPAGDDFFTAVDYRGAVGGNSNWLKGWTALDQYGFLSDEIKIPVAVEEDAPVAFGLGQNFPNPFNPTTTISFSLSEQTHVSLTVYDVLGRKVAILADNIMTPGGHSVVWQAENVAAGMYFYRLEAGSQVITRKMNFVK